jgi:predicted O-methyltransferase YrrM
MTFEEIINTTKASQDPEELLKVYLHVEKIKPKVIVEVGSWKGYSLKLLDDLYHPETLIGIESDKSVFLPELKYPMLFADSNKIETKQLLLRFLQSRKIDFLFIDGDHHYEAVKKDFELYSPLVRSGGIIGFHDVALEGKNADGHSWDEIGVQVKRFWDEVRINYHNVEYHGSSLGTGTGLLFID